MLKNQLADAELTKRQVLANIDKVKDSFIQMELNLIKKYGKDASINIQTGEITPKTDGINTTSYPFVQPSVDDYVIGTAPNATPANQTSN